MKQREREGGIFKDKDGEENNIRDVEINRRRVECLVWNFGGSETVRVRVRVRVTCKATRGVPNGTHQILVLKLGVTVSSNFKVVPLRVSEMELNANSYSTDPLPLMDYDDSATNAWVWVWVWPVGIWNFDSSNYNHKSNILPLSSSKRKTHSHCLFHLHRRF